ncbi:PAS domain-containing sensor histidine kinase [Hymenobacter sp. BT770]|uniref:PAS domain-containing sensor histidine kinase n=1 Tax=Hymenobacter sp. BT770 TaxID=2886942 RepID=UPI001D11C6D4|nr:PAS domain-containing sensor histidine kinase [Hymenobacter sp. BT770]MCC3154532.1 PAS domain-containing sensor histidine kinase [Hymenobacter sp. BT770]MDO3416404.1 PAS domain-containing sensor histidine kinase [Hymenobacter sp. BT770]
MSEPLPTVVDLTRENEELRYQLEEAQELIHAIRTGAIDALAVQSAQGPRIFTLQGADQGYRTLIEQMNEGALLLSEDATVLYCNACLAGLLGHALGELMGSSFDAFVPVVFQDYWASLMLRGWAGKSKGELPLQTKAGALVPFSVSMNVLMFNETPTLAVIVTDLSAQREITAIQAQVLEQNALLDRKTEELKREEAGRLVGERAAAEASRLLEGISQIAWTTNALGDHTYRNRRWYDYIGQGQGQGAPASRSWRERLHPDDVAPTLAHWQHSLHTGQPYEVECRIRNHAGAYRWMLGRALPSRNEQGEIIQWIGTYTDIHEHKLALERIDQGQRELRDNNEQLTRVNVDLDNFIYTASHDLKAPISNIEGLLHALLVELPADTVQADPVQPILELMQDSVNRFKRTIEHLTDVSKLQKEHGLPTEAVDLATVVQDVVLDLEPLIQAADARLEVDVQAAPSVSFSEKNLRSVVFNLLSNALKYRAPDRPPHVRLRARPEESGVVLEVQDNGLGLDAASEQKMFGMFQRFHDHVEGSGIGLYMVKKMVENAGGRIAVRSELGVGSTFLVYFSR